MKLSLRQLNELNRKLKMPQLNKDKLDDFQDVGYIESTIKTEKGDSLLYVICFYKGEEVLDVSVWMI